MIKCDECKLNLKHDNFCVIWLGEAVGWQWWPHKPEHYKECHRNHFPKEYFPPIAQQPLSGSPEGSPKSAEPTSDNGKRCRKECSLK